MTTITTTTSSTDIIKLACGAVTDNVRPRQRSNHDHGHCHSHDHDKQPSGVLTDSVVCGMWNAIKTNAV